MKIFYQGTKGSYTSIPVYDLAKKLKIEEENIFGTNQAFTEIWKNIDDNGGIGIFPIENSFAGMVHENLFNFLHFDFKIIGEIDVQVEHCLLSKEKNIADVKKVFSHYQALNQCFSFLNKNNIKKEATIDTAFSAKMVSESDEKGIGAIASKEAGENFGLNILKKGIQDQKGNFTRMFLVVKKNCKNFNEKKLNEENIKLFCEKKGKITILFELKNTPSALYNTLGCFDKNNINLTKIESMPNLKNTSSYLFYIDFIGELKDLKVQNTLENLKKFAENIKILGEY